MNKIHADDYEFVLFEDDDFLYTGAKGYAFDPVGIQSPNYMLTSPKKLSWYNKNHEQYKLYTIHEDQEHCFGGYFIDIINRIRKFFSFKKTTVVAEDCCNRRLHIRQRLTLGRWSCPQQYIHS